MYFFVLKREEFAQSKTMDPKSFEKEKLILKQKIEQLERENKSLKKSLYELSIRFNSLKVAPFQVLKFRSKYDIAQRVVG